MVPENSYIRGDTYATSTLDELASVPQRLTPAKAWGRILPDALLAMRMGGKWGNLGQKGDFGGFFSELR